MNGWREFDKVLLTAGVVLTSGLVIYSSHYDPGLLEWSKGVAQGVFGAWLLVLRGATAGSAPAGPHQ